MNGFGVTASSVVVAIAVLKSSRRASRVAGYLGGPPSLRWLLQFRCDGCCSFVVDGLWQLVPNMFSRCRLALVAFWLFGSVPRVLPPVNDLRRADD